jgi:hypothetical protein
MKIVDRRTTNFQGRSSIAESVGNRPLIVDCRTLKGDVQRKMLNVDCRMAKARW